MTTEAARRPRLGVVMTIPLCVRAFMGPHLPRLSERFDITLVTNACEEELADLLTTRIRFQPLDIRRDIAVLADLRALLELWRLMRRERFDAVHSMTPKGGLLAMLAAMLAGVRVRVHCFTGQVWATRTGFKRTVLKTMDRLIAACATHLFADSPSQRDFLARERVVAADRLTVTGKGSVCGVDTSRFKPDPAARARVRGALGFQETDLVALYLGRLNADKGLAELADAFKRIADSQPALRLLVVGPDEGGTLAMMQARLVGCADRVRFAGGTAEPEVYMASGDFFVLPSYREGFGVPAIGTRIYGLIDAIVENETGLLVPPRDVRALAEAMLRMAGDGALRERLAAGARRRVQTHFRQEQFTDALLDFYARVIPS
jgi:glycosyltransferase involved in cell wall biosynthesis